MKIPSSGRPTKTPLKKGIESREVFNRGWGSPSRVVQRATLRGLKFTDDTRIQVQQFNESKEFYMMIDSNIHPGWHITIPMGKHQPKKPDEKLDYDFKNYHVSSPGTALEKARFYYEVEGSTHYQERTDSPQQSQWWKEANEVVLEIFSVNTQSRVTQEAKERLKKVEEISKKQETVFQSEASLMDYIYGRTKRSNRQKKSEERKKKAEPYPVKSSPSEEVVPTNLQLKPPPNPDQL